jgi:8-oxo-dGTP pyrophosphatase MutT (NUDIX family)
MGDQKERVRVVLPYKGAYLLERLTNPDWPQSLGKKRHIGGGIEEGETPQEAAAREMFEELGIQIDPSAFTSLGKHENQYYLELREHPLAPGEFKAIVGSDPVITLECTLPEGDDYWGPDLEIFSTPPGTI